MHFWTLPISDYDTLRSQVVDKVGACNIITCFLWDSNMLSPMCCTRCSRSKLNVVTCVMGWQATPRNNQQGQKKYKSVSHEPNDSNGKATNYFECFLEARNEWCLHPTNKRSSRYIHKDVGQYGNHTTYCNIFLRGKACRWTPNILWPSAKHVTKSMHLSMFQSLNCTLIHLLMEVRLCKTLAHY